MSTSENACEMNRRSFLKAAGAVGGLAALGAAFGPNAQKAEAKEWDSIDDLIQPTEEFQRYDAADMCFSIGLALQGKHRMPEPLDPMLERQLKGEDETKAFKPGDPGYTRLDAAFMNGSHAVNKLCGSSVTMGGRCHLSVANMVGDDGELIPISLFAQSSASFPSGGKGCFDVKDEPYQFESPEAASYAIKKAAKLFGASKCGIAPYDERFVFKTEPYAPRDIHGKPIKELEDPMRPVDMGFTPKSVIVFVHEMDYEAMKCQATYIENAATYQGYSRMPYVSLSMAKFLRDLGYNTFHCGNNASASVAEAVRAGLGEGGRMSVLITEEWGPRVRISKVYTDLECAYDKPRTFGVTEFCEVCQVCADSCPSGAITHLSIDDPENKAHSTCSQAGVRKYYLDAQKCYYNWFEQSAEEWNDCGICISTCPYNKPKTWNHDLVKIVTRIPGLNSFARYFDEFFGYGGIRGPETIANFWKKTI